MFPLEDLTLPIPESRYPKRNEAMEVLYKAWRAAPGVCYDQVDVVGHHAYCVQLHPPALQRNGERIEDQVRNFRIGTQEEVPENDAARDEVGFPGLNDAWLGHGRRLYDKFYARADLNYFDRLGMAADGGRHLFPPLRHPPPPLGDHRYVSHGEILMPQVDLLGHAACTFDNMWTDEN
jgi:hypothetical protein